MSILSKCSDVFWKIVGNTKVFRYPVWFVYDPDQPKVDGSHMLKLMEVAKPGDILMRGWRHYLNGYFIPGDYSHGGIYLGNNEVLHAVPQGVCRCNVIDFINADRICLLRPKKHVSIAVETALMLESRHLPYDYKMTKGDEALYCFELCAECYRRLANIEKVQPKLLGGLIKRSEPAWLSFSFLNSPDFYTVMEFNPDKGVDFLNLTTETPKTE